MKTKLRVALFVEGTDPQQASSQDGVNRLLKIWNEHLPTLLGIGGFEHVFGISKLALLAMDPANPPMSGNAEGFDHLLARQLAFHHFEAAVLAWDLHPKWNGMATYCRWDETLNLYRFLSQSTDTKLPVVWKEKAAQRYESLRARSSPSARTRPVRLEEGMVLPVCMEPMFEGLLVQNEAATWRALGNEGKTRPPRWTAIKGWGDPKERQPDSKILAPAISALRAMPDKPDCAKQIRGDFRTRKDEWGEYLLKQLMADARGRELLEAHPVCLRLKELLG